jgi:aspartyl-tRNA(Asn)/glutamyl-tRNA(Gln) amidotransferase subunit A
MSTTDAPWAGDACSLVDAFRRGERSPVEELDATLAAIAGSSLNAWSHLDEEAARETASAADVSLPSAGSRSASRSSTTSPAGPSPRPPCR